MASKALYFPLERFSLWNRYYAYLDAKEYQADGLFVRHEVPVKFLQEYGKPGSPYVMVLCRIHRKYESEFCKALDELPNKMLLCGYPDYEKVCGEMLQQIESYGKDACA